MEVGKPYLFTIDLWATSNVFRPGHRIRLEISSSNFQAVGYPVHNCLSAKPEELANKSKEAHRDLCQPKILVQGDQETTTYANGTRDGRIPDPDSCSSDLVNSQ